MFPSKKHGPVTTTANVWVAISGSLNETRAVNFPKSSLEFVFHVSFISVRIISIFIDINILNLFIEHF